MGQRPDLASWLRRVRAYSSNLFADDVLAGAVTGVLLVPQALAYALLAGLPPQAGLYAAMAL
jgi:SulP family sulfate permease